jgi:hypothetical protein
MKRLDPRNQFARFRTQDHWMDGHAGDARVGPHGTRSRKSIGDRVAHRAFGGEIEPTPHRRRKLSESPPRSPPACAPSTTISSFVRRNGDTEGGDLDFS